MCDIKVWCENCWVQTIHKPEHVDDDVFWCCINCDLGIKKSELIYRIDMFNVQNLTGDDGSVGKELLSGISEVEEKSRAIYLAVKENYFTLEEALNIYGVCVEDYQIFLKKYENS